MKKYFSVILVFSFFSCMIHHSYDNLTSLTGELPKSTPVPFMESLTPSDKLIHKGILNPELTEYYYSISDKQFDQFDVYLIHRSGHAWSKPQKAFFNSDFNDHGMSFSPDGCSIYFSSTRPTGIQGIAETWHLWKSDRINGRWAEPEFVDIPNLRDKLVSHPVITTAGQLYFHSSNLDYSDMHIYQSRVVDGTCSPASKTSISGAEEVSQSCTPYVSPSGDYMIYAAIGDQLELMIAYNDGSDQWIQSRKLNNLINHNGQGNPSVTLDDQFLFYTTGTTDGSEWKVNWVNIEHDIKL